MNQNRALKKRNALGVGVGAGLGVGLLGALALAMRFGWRHSFSRSKIPDAISPAIFATRVANTAAGEIVYHTSGNIGENPLVFLHGIFPGASSFEWSKIYPAFAHHHHVLVPDLIGFGESQRPYPAISATAQVDSLAQFLDATTGGHPVTIVASGLSANLALLLAASYPKKIVRLLFWMPLLAIQKMPVLAMHQRLACFPLLARIAYQKHLSAEPTIKDWLLNSGFSAEDPSLFEATTALTSMAQQYGSEHAFLAQSTAKYWRGMRSKLSLIQTPVTLLIKKESKHCAEDAFLNLRPFVTRFALEEIETTSSLAPLTDSRIVIEALGQILDTPFF